MITRCTHIEGENTICWSYQTWSKLFVLSLLTTIVQIKTCTLEGAVTFQKLLAIATLFWEDWKVHVQNMYQQSICNSKYLLYTHGHLLQRVCNHSSKKICSLSMKSRSLESRFDTLKCSNFFLCLAPAAYTKPYLIRNLQF